MIYAEIEFENHECIKYPYEKHPVFKEFLMEFYPELVSYDTDEDETSYINEEIIDVTIRKEQIKNFWDRYRREEEIMIRIKNEIKM